MSDESTKLYPAAIDAYRAVMTFHTASDTAGHGTRAAVAGKYEPSHPF